MLEQRINEWVQKVLAAYEAPSMTDTRQMIADVDRIIADEFDHEPVLVENQQEQALQTAVQYPLIQGSRSLTAGDLDIQERISTENGWITFCLDLLADEETILGRQLSNENEDSYIQTYTSFNVHTGQVDDTLDIVVRSPGGDEWFSCILTDETRELLKKQMDAFCVELYGEHLPDPQAKYQDEPALPQTESDMTEANHPIGPAIG